MIKGKIIMVSLILLINKEMIVVLKRERQLIPQLKSKVPLPTHQQKKETVLVTPKSHQQKQDQEELKLLL